MGRLDALVSIAPAAVPLLLHSWAVARLANPDAQATRVGCAALVASSVEMLHAAALDAALAQWQQRLEDGERRARSGVPLSAPAGVHLDAASREMLLDSLRPGGQPRAVLLRAVCAAGSIEASSDDNTPGGRSEAELVAALLLTATGLTDRVRLLPFAERSEERADALAAWRARDYAPYTEQALSALATAARRLRVQLRLLLDAMPDEDDHLSSIGRAAVTARQALQVLRDSRATSMPDLARRLDCSRPAAGAALERLVELGLAEEITGRARDRVFVWAGAWGIG